MHQLQDLKMFLDRRGMASGELFLPVEVTGASGMADEAAVRGQYAYLTRQLIRKGLTITAMESCTAGQISSLITDTEGSSAVFKGAYITYSNEAKIARGIPPGVIADFGVYSPQTAAAMAAVCREDFDADIGIGITGSFGNTDPDNADSVPGEVYFAVAGRDAFSCYHCTVPPQPSRPAYKLYMAAVAADALIAQWI